MTSIEDDAATYGDVFLSVDRSILLHRRLGIAEPWSEWELPRRLAVLDSSEQRTPELDVGSSSALHMSHTEGENA